MLHRYLPLATIVSSLGLAACAGNAGGGTALQRNLGLGGRSANAKILDKGCLDLKATVANVRASRTGATLHSRDYDIGKVARVRGDHSLAFVTVTDRASQDELTRRSLTGANAPVYLTAARADEVMNAPAARALLDVDTQTDCTAVKFSAGPEFKVTHGNSSFITMTNPETGEVREYGRQGESLTMTVFARADIDNCNGGKSTGDTERISTRLAWGKAKDSVSLVPGYAKRIGVEATTTAEKFKATMTALPSKLDAVKCGQ